MRQLGSASMQSTLVCTSGDVSRQRRSAFVSIFVNGEGLEYYIERVDMEAESGDKRYFETYLKNDDYIFLIGNAASKDGETIIEKDDYHKVFGIAFPHEVALRNKFAPLYKSFLATLFFITLIITYILIS